MAQAAVAASGTAPEGRNRLLIIGAIVFGLITAVLLFTTLQNSSDGGSSSAIQVTTQDVLVVTRNVESNTLLTEDMLELRAVPADQVLVGSYPDVETAIGLPLRYPLQAGEQVTNAKIGISQIASEDDLALILEPGMRAFAVEASEVNAVGGNLLPGNLVDVIAVFNEETFGVTRAQTVLQNIEILAIAQEALEPVPASASGSDADQAGTGIQSQRPDEVERQPGARSVTLAVDLEQAQLLATLQTQGDVEIWLALRPIDDTEEQELQGTNLSPFFSAPLR